MVEWEGGKLSDLLADAVVAALLQAAAQAAGTPAGMSAAEEELRAARAAGDEARAAEAECGAVAAMLATQFGPVKVDRGSGEVHVQVRLCLGGAAAQQRGREGAAAACILGGRECGPDGCGSLVRSTLDNHRSGGVLCRCVSRVRQVGGSAGAPASGLQLVVRPSDGKVICADAGMRARVEKAVHRLLALLRPLPLPTSG